MGESFFFLLKIQALQIGKKDAMMSWPLSSHNPVVLCTVWGLIAIIDWPDISAMPAVTTHQLLPSLAPDTLDMKSSE